MVAITLVVAFVAGWDWSPGPRVAGRSLRSWVGGSWNGTPPPEEFLRQAGHDAYDWLIAEALRPQPPGESIFSFILGEFRIRWNPSDERRQRALTALGGLGTNAVPHLLRRIRQLPEAPRHQSPAYWHLVAHVTTPAHRPWVITQLNELAAQHGGIVRLQVLDALSQPNCYEASALPTLVAGCRDPDSRVRRSALWAMRSDLIAAAVAVPVFIAALEDPDAGVVDVAICGIIDRAKDAAPAKPKLRELRKAVDQGRLLRETTVPRDQAKDLAKRIDGALAAPEKPPR